MSRNSTNGGLFSFTRFFRSFFDILSSFYCLVLLPPPSMPSQKPRNPRKGLQNPHPKVEKEKGHNDIDKYWVSVGWIRASSVHASCVVWRLSYGMAWSRLGWSGFVCFLPKRGMAWHLSRDRFGLPPAARCIVAVEPSKVGGKASRMPSSHPSPTIRPLHTLRLRRRLCLFCRVGLGYLCLRLRRRESGMGSGR